MHVVVVGGGSAGLGACVVLAKAKSRNLELRITLIDPKDFFEVRWAAIRAFFDENIREQMLVKYDTLLPRYNIKHIRGNVTVVNKTSLELSTGATVDFDACIYAVGAACPVTGVDPAGPVGYTMAGRSAQLAGTGASLKGNSALVIGGGTLGCEVAGELKERGSEVTLVHSGTEVCQEMRTRARRVVKNKMEEMGIQVELGRRAVQSEDGSWSTLSKNGGDQTRLNMDEKAMFIESTGYVSRNAPLIAGDLVSAVDGNGWANTDEYFRVSGSDGRIFAFGDCSKTGENNVMTIYANYNVVVSNILATLRCIADGKSAQDISVKQLNKMKPKPINLTVLTLGPSSGVADTPLGTFQSLLPPFKNRTLFISNAMGYVS